MRRGIYPDSVRLESVDRWTRISEGASIGLRSFIEPASCWNPWLPQFFHRVQQLRCWKTKMKLGNGCSSPPRNGKVQGIGKRSEHGKNPPRANETSGKPTLRKTRDRLDPGPPLGKSKTPFSFLWVWRRNGWGRRGSTSGEAFTPNAGPCIFVMTGTSCTKAFADAISSNF